MTMTTTRNARRPAAWLRVTGVAPSDAAPVTASFFDVPM